ncbi:TetR/AcrR family transcriptional regulator [Spirillospora sp. CA-294931]|uniref:TetR/AcrR family transcriptional regulator n=1 Tax=Spirillospora sp. CA-294931 TaxID=3240042 RepID=UPI003D913E87
MTTSTRDRILDVAMGLFGEFGYRGTSVARIEKAVGLTPGAGGLYHHFRTKEELLAAGIERHLSRLEALRDIQRAIGPLDDPRAELTLVARYTLAEFDREAELVRILAAESRARPSLLDDAVRQMFTSTNERFAEWLCERGLSPERAQAVTAVGLGALTSHRLMGILLVPAAPCVDDEAFVETWVEMVLAMIGADATP